MHSDFGRNYARPFSVGRRRLADEIAFCRSTRHTPRHSFTKVMPVQFQLIVFLGCHMTLLFARHTPQLSGVKPAVSVLLLISPIRTFVGALPQIVRSNLRWN